MDRQECPKCGYLMEPWDMQCLRCQRSGAVTTPSLKPKVKIIQPQVVRTAPKQTQQTGRVLVQRNANGVIINANNLTVNDVVGDRVLCPACGEKVFEQWPFGWDAHSAYQCRGMSANATAKARKVAYKMRYCHLFR